MRVESGEWRVESGGWSVLKSIDLRIQVKIFDLCNWIIAYVIAGLTRNPLRISRGSRVKLGMTDDLKPNCTARKFSKKLNS